MAPLASLALAFTPEGVDYLRENNMFTSGGQRDRACRVVMLFCELISLGYGGGAKGCAGG